MQAKIAAMAGPHHDSMTVVLDSAQPPIAGQVRTTGQPERPFVGWLELLAALDAANGDLQAVKREPTSASRELLHDAPGGGSQTSSPRSRIRVPPAPNVPTT